MRGRLLAVAVAAVALYGVAPAVIDVLGGWRDLDRITAGWWLLAVTAQVTSWACLWSLQRLALHTDRWLPVATSQLAGGALGRVIPGGAAAAAGLQYRMLRQAGVAGPTAATGLAVGSLLLLAALAGMPLLALPAILAGRSVPDGLLQAAAVCLVVFSALFALGAALLAGDRAVRLLARAAAAAGRLLHRPRRGTERLAVRLLVERDEIRSTLGASWRTALASAVGRWVFDLLSLVAVLEAVDARPRFALVLLAYCAAQLLAQVPLTPGGLGVVEAGLTGTLVLAGVPAAMAALATLAYRLVSYWLPLPAGAAAWALHHRRTREAAVP